jgi:hypothetical protein
MNLGMVHPLHLVVRHDGNEYCEEYVGSNWEEKEGLEGLRAMKRL